jgi:hypothetical protein
VTESWHNWEILYLKIESSIVVHACNLSNLRGGSRRIMSSRPIQASSSQSELHNEILSQKAKANKETIYRMSNL